MITYAGLFAKGTPKKKLKTLDGRLHAHACNQCGQRYSDACTQAGVNWLCQSCRCDGRHARPLWELSPQPCCRENSVPVSAVETVMSYRLAGSKPWWKCGTCSRTIPFNPSKESNR